MTKLVSDIDVLNSLGEDDKAIMERKIDYDEYITSLVNNEPKDANYYKRHFYFIPGPIRMKIDEKEFDYNDQIIAAEFLTLDSHTIAFKPNEQYLTKGTIDEAAIKKHLKADIYFVYPFIFHHKMQFREFVGMLTCPEIQTAFPLIKMAFTYSPMLGSKNPPPSIANNHQEVIITDGHTTEIQCVCLDETSSVYSKIYETCFDKFKDCGIIFLYDNKSKVRIFLPSSEFYKV